MTARAVEDASIALRASGLLAAFNQARVLSSADVHVAACIGRLAGERDERVLLAAALAVRAVRAGSVCVEPATAAQTTPTDDTGDGEADPAAERRPDLPWPDPDDWLRALGGSPMVAVGRDGPADRPLRWVDGRLYLDRYWRDEERIRADVGTRLASTLAVDEAVLKRAVTAAFPAAQDSRQRTAAAACALSRLTVLTGGPGTGKTTTIAGILAVLDEVAGPGLRVALAAPTGKAAARLSEAVRLAAPDRPAPAATTVHRLLGWRRDSTTRFRHDRHRRLPHDVVVVDETSMMSLPLIARLLEALRPDARLLLVGDPDQLASVEAGAVLGDLVDRPAAPGPLPGQVRRLGLDRGGAPEPDLATGLGNGVVRLVTVHRHGGQIDALARAIRAEDGAAATAALLAGGNATLVGPRITGGSSVATGTDAAHPDAADAAHPDAAHPDAAYPDDTALTPVRDAAVEAGLRLRAAARAGDERAALAALEDHRLLLAHRRGRFGALHWARRVEEWVDHAEDAEPAVGPWSVGRPLLVTANDPSTGLFNGDTGVLLDDGEGGVVAVMGDAGRTVRLRPHRLPEVETLYAMTVHKAQGSQFRTVSLVLPPTTSPLLTRELLYTAVTRARERVVVVGTPEAVRAAVANRVRRASGLQRR